MDDWNAAQYLRFEKERTQPSIDLINRIGVGNPATILDVGCGPGNSTAQLAARYPDAKVTGLDSSPGMIDRARADYPCLEFVSGDISRDDLLPTGSYDIVFANAVIQWVPDHPALLKRLFGLVKPGGALACQTPVNADEPSHRAMRTLADSEKWRNRFDCFRIFHNLTPSGYYDLFTAMTPGFSLWTTTYYHPMKEHRDIVEWLKGTGLRSYLAKLSDAHRREFEEELLERYREAYPRQQNGDVVLRFPRLFFVLRKPAL